MQCRASATAGAARPGESTSRGPIAFAVRDATGRGCAFEIDGSAAEALVFGATSALRVTAPGVLPAHVVVLPHDGKLVAASASAANPALLNGAALPTTWTVLTVPSRIRIGAAAIDFFFLRESGTVLIDQDIETTVADPGASRSEATRIDARPAAAKPAAARPVTAIAPATATREACPRPLPSRPLPPPTPPPFRRSGPRLVARTGDTTTTNGALPPAPLPAPLQPVSPVDMARAAVASLKLQWTTATTSTRVLLGIVAILMVFLVAR